MIFRKSRELTIYESDKFSALIYELSFNVIDKLLEILPNR